MRKQAATLPCLLAYKGRTGMKNPPKSFATKLIHAGEQRIVGAVRLPVFQTAMFEYSGDDPRGARYIRYLNNPNQVALSDKLAALEGADEQHPSEDLAGGLLGVWRN